MQKQEPQAYNDLISFLSDEEKGALQKNFETAYEQQVECENFLFQ
jgi:hypothetical protein